MRGHQTYRFNIVIVIATWGCEIAGKGLHNESPAAAVTASTRGHLDFLISLANFSTSSKNMIIIHNGSSGYGGGTISTLHCDHVLATGDELWKVLVKGAFLSGN